MNATCCTFSGDISKKRKRIILLPAADFLTARKEGT
jgi:hypothetical protein